MSFKITKLVDIAITTAEDRHGYLGALRNNEFDAAASIVTAIYLNKETELGAFKTSLSEFNENALKFMIIFQTYCN